MYHLSTVTATDGYCMHWDLLPPTKRRRKIPCLKLTFSNLKMDGWKTSLLLGWPIFRCELLVSGSVPLHYHPFESCSVSFWWLWRLRPARFHGFSGKRDGKPQRQNPRTKMAQGSSKICSKISKFCINKWHPVDFLYLYPCKILSKFRFGQFGPWIVMTAIYQLFQWDFTIVVFPPRWCKGKVLQAHGVDLVKVLMMIHM